MTQETFVLRALATYSPSGQTLILNLLDDRDFPQDAAHCMIVSGQKMLWFSRPSHLDTYTETRK